MTENGQTCTDINMAYIIGDAECSEAVLLFGIIYDGHHEKDNVPTGCYILDGAIGRYNTHKSGNRHSLTKSICKGN